MKKPSLMKSVISGVVGGIAGAVGLALLAATGGAAIGAVLGAFGVVGATTTVAAAALGGGIAGGMGGAALGAPLGAATGIVRSREVNRPEAEDVVNLAKMSFAQGVAVGQSHQVSGHAMGHAKDVASFVDREGTRRALAGEHHRG